MFPLVVFTRSEPEITFPEYTLKKDKSPTWASLIVLKTNKYGLTGIAIKVLDGNQRAIEAASVAVLNHLNVLKDCEKKRLLQYKTTPLYNHRKIHIGDIKSDIIN